MSRAGFVAVLGRPNVGKSTLVNTAVGQKVSIVSDKPQTTRSRILGICHRPDAQIVFVDTPGIHKATHQLNRRMVEVSFEASGTNDANLVIIDGSAGLGPGDRFVVERARAAGRPMLLAINKVDRVARKTDLLPLLEQCGALAPWRDMVPVSALTGENVDRLLDRLVEALPESEAPYPDDMVTDQTERALVGELIREQVLRLTRDELPFATAVTVERWEERIAPEATGSDEEAGDEAAPAPSSPATVIHATIWVEKQGHKGIVVGAGGRLVKEIGVRSRATVEDLLERHVYLELEVKVREGWREDRQFLRRLFPRT
jgi:GTP-binding protein Era